MQSDFEGDLSVWYSSEVYETFFFFRHLVRFKRVLLKHNECCVVCFDCSITFELIR